MQIQTPFELLAEELGVAAGRVEREVALRFDALRADIERRFAERELHIERLQKVVDVLMSENFQRWDKMVVDRLSSLRDGKDGVDGKDGADGKDGLNGADGKDGTDGKDGATGSAGPQGPAGLPGLPGSPGERGEMGQAGKDGMDGPQGVMGPVGPIGPIGEQGIQGERGLEGPAGINGKDGQDGERGPEGAPGKLPMVKQWAPGVFYEGDVCTHKGSLYQAIQDTGQEPHPLVASWVCLAASGIDGKDGRDGIDGKDGQSLTIRETFDPKQKYEALDVVTLDNRWFVAKHDDPGDCPGPGWKAGPGIGKTGRPGERGAKGEPGPKGETGKAFEIARWEIVTARYEAIPIMTDGSHGPTIHLRELFARYQEEVG